MAAIAPRSGLLQLYMVPRSRRDGVLTLELQIGLQLHFCGLSCHHRHPLSLPGTEALNIGEWPSDPTVK